jgi:hypothetical protein
MVDLTVVAMITTGGVEAGAWSSSLVDVPNEVDATLVDVTGIWLMLKTVDVGRVVIAAFEVDVVIMPVKLSVTALVIVITVGHVTECEVVELLDQLVVFLRGIPFYELISELVTCARKSYLQVQFQLCIQ